jgi:tRNA(fMet)-specific endonuclease VapC
MTFYPNANKIRAEPFHGNENEFALPSVVLDELRYGWLKMNAGKKKDDIGHYLQTVVSVLPVFDYDTKAAHIHAQLRADSEKAGKTLPFVDGQIAAIAVSHGLTLVTRNTKDFSDIAQLQLTNWFD